MKVIVLSGDPNKQETLLQKLLPALDAEGNTIYLHNALHDEMYLALKGSEYEKAAVNDSSAYKVVNGQLLYTGLSKVYKAPILGHTFSISFEIQKRYFTPAVLQKLETIIKTVYVDAAASSIAQKDLFTNVISDVNDIKYIDVLVIYNVIDIRSVLASKARLGNKLKWFWYNFVSDNSIYNRVTPGLLSSIPDMYNSMCYKDNATDLNLIVSEVLTSTATNELQSVKEDADEIYSPVTSVSDQLNDIRRRFTPTAVTFD